MRKIFAARSCDGMIVSKEGDIGYIRNRNWGYDNFVLPSGNARRMELRAKVKPGYLEKELKREDILSLIKFIPNRGMWIGADPEIFVFTRSGKVMPAFSFLPSKKELQERCGGISEQPFWDGFQAEFCVEPYTCLAYLTDAVRRGLRALLTKAREVNSGAHFRPVDTVEPSLEFLQSLPYEYVELGCMPSRNIYGKSSLPLDPMTPLRSAGSHIHISINFPHAKTHKEFLVNDIVFAMDVLAGILSVYLLNGLETKKRRRLYGRAGEYRLPHYGIEYRVLSAVILMHPILYQLFFSIVRAASAIGRAGCARLLFPFSDNDVASIINGYDVDSALEVIKCLRDVYLTIFEQIWEGGAEYLYNSLISGEFMESLDHDIIKNWRLDSDWESHANCSKSTVGRWIGDRKERRKR